MRSLYIHIPFCKGKCYYCDFLSFKKKSNREVKSYLNALIKELSFYKSQSIKTIYIGGGTPSILDLEDFEQLFEALYRIFDLGNLKEFTLEANPESLSSQKLKLWMEYGVNRVSLGVQSFNDMVLKRVNRVTVQKDIYRAFDLIKDSGIRSFSIDLIIGIQNRNIYRNDLKRAVEIGPNHISAYLLTVGEATPLKGMIENGKIKIPCDKEYEYLYNYTVANLDSYGYRRYEISNFSKIGCESLHNLNYWMYGEYIGVGLGAFSFIENKRIKNSDDLSDYIQKIDKGIKPSSEIEYLSEEKTRLERIMLGLRMNKGVKKNYILKGLDEDRKGKVLMFIAMLENNQLVEKDSYRVMLSNRGIIRSNTVIAELFDVLEGKD